MIFYKRTVLFDKHYLNISAAFCLKMSANISVLSLHKSRKSREEDSFITREDFGQSQECPYSLSGWKKRKIVGIKRRKHQRWHMAVHTERGESPRTCWGWAAVKARKERSASIWSHVLHVNQYTPPPPLLFRYDQQTWPDRWRSDEARQVWGQDGNRWALLTVAFRIIHFHQ